MPPASRRRFAAALRGLDAEALARLTADLLAARGHETERDGRRVVASDGDERRVLVAHDATGGLARVVPGRRRDPPRPAAVGADEVVTNVPASTPGVTGAADLRRALLYAVPPATGDALCRRHLGIDAREEAASRTSGVEAGVVAGVVAATLALVAVAALSTGVPVDDGRPGSAAQASTPAATTTAPAAVASGPLPPGVGAAGVRDANALSEAHVAALRGRPYAWTVTYREYRGGDRVVRRYQHATVAGPQRYASTVRGSGEPTGTGALVVGTTAYANGSVRYEATDEGILRRPLPVGNADTGGDESDRFAERAGRLVRWYLSTRESSVERLGDGRIRVRASADPWPGTTAERPTAVVREDGLVLELRRRHGRPDANVTVEVAFRYHAVGTASVDRPPWVPPADNGSVGGDEGHRGRTVTGDTRGSTGGDVGRRPDGLPPGD